MIGSNGPWRSDTRPSSTLFPASSAAEQRKTAPIATAPNPSSASRSGAQHPDDAEEQCRQQHEPAGDEDSPIAERTHEVQRALGLLAGHARCDRSPRDEAERREADRAESPADAGDRGDAADHRAEQRAGHGRANAFPISRPRRPAGAAATSQPSAPVHENAEASALCEAGEVELPGLVGDAEEDRADPDERQPDDRGRFDTEPSGNEAARDRAEERTRGIRGREHARTGLAEPQRLGVVREQRSERREEQGVDEDDRARQEQKPPHGATLPIRDEGVACNGPRRTRAPSGRSRRHGVPARRSRLGSRCRHEPVGR